MSLNAMASPAALEPAPLVTLIAAGCSIKAVQEALGHANASETLDTYSHLWPSDDDRIRDAVQSLHGHGRPVSSTDSVAPALQDPRS